MAKVLAGQMVGSKKPATPILNRRKKGTTQAEHDAGLEGLSIERRRTLALKFSGIATWAWNVGTDRVDADAAFRDLFGFNPADELTSQSVVDRIHRDDRPRIRKALMRTITTGVPYDEQFRVTSGAQERWLRGIGEVHQADGNGVAQVVVGLNMDVTESMETRARLQVVVGEMRHRIKNSLAMVSSLASATARECVETAEFVEKFRGRIDALAAAQRAIGATDETHLVDLRAAVEGAMAPLLATSDWRRRISMALEDASVSPSLGQALALTTYELATNAIKYGALRFENGTIELSTSLSGNDDALHIHWLETHTGERLQDRPSGTGFGTKLIERLVASENGTIERNRLSDGYEVRLAFPMSPVSGH